VKSFDWQNIKNPKFFFKGTGLNNILRQTTITVKKNTECGASSENMLCAGNISHLDNFYSIDY
jgi:hypothetical protein